MQASDETSYAPAPKPANVRYNDWRRVKLPPPEEFTPSLPVSVVMPCYRTPAAVLARTLAALESQTYPRRLFEVVIVDDGSEPPLAPPRSPLNVRVVRQERRGVGIARARNTGVREAAHGIVLFLDGDSLAEAGWMAAHARWHHVVSDALTVGFRARVSMDGIDAETIRRRPGTLRNLFSDRAAEPQRLEKELYMLRTNDLTARADDLFRALVGGNFGVSREFYRSVGGNDESFVRWGVEDDEFAWRVYAQGGLFVPVRDAFAWHQGRRAGEKEARKRSFRIQRAKAAHRIAHPAFRSAKLGRIYTVPRYAVTIEAARCPAEQTIEAAANVLADRERDLAVRIEIDEGAGGEQAEWLREVFGSDPRVRIAAARSALDEFPAAAFHVTLPAAVSAGDLVYRLRAGLGGAVLAVSSLPDGSSVSIARSWALHRARRTGGAPADFGEVRKIAPAKLKLKSAAPGRWDCAAALDAMGIPARRDYLLDRMRDIHGLREAWWFLRGLVRRRLSEDARPTGGGAESETPDLAEAGKWQAGEAAGEEASR